MRMCDNCAGSYKHLRMGIPRSECSENELWAGVICESFEQYHRMLGPQYPITAAKTSLYHNPNPEFSISLFKVAQTLMMETFEILQKANLGRRDHRRLHSRR